MNDITNTKKMANSPEIPDLLLFATLIHQTIAYFTQAALRNDVGKIKVVS